VAKSRYFPELSARSDETYGGVAPGNTTYLALTYQPGNGLSVLSASKEAESRKEIAEAALNNSRVDIRTNVHSDWNQYTSQLQQIETLSNLAETTRGVYESYVRQYTVGKKTWIEVLNSRKEATQAKYSLTDAQWQSFIAGIRLQISTGILNSDTLMMVQ
jgi:adhesin transport system outer membrane protein